MDTKACQSVICDAVVPKLSVYNKMEFVEQPSVFVSNGKRLPAYRIPIMQVCNLPCGGQILVHGDIVNVPVDIASTLNVLPRSMSNSDMVSIKFKRKKAYKYCESKENK